MPDEAFKQSYRWRRVIFLCGCVPVCHQGLRCFLFVEVSGGRVSVPKKYALSGLDCCLGSSVALCELGRGQSVSDIPFCEEFGVF